MIWKAAGTSNLFLETMKVNTEEKLVITPLSLTFVSEITASEAKKSLGKRHEIRCQIRVEVRASQTGIGRAWRRIVATVSIWLTY